MISTDKKKWWCLRRTDEKKKEPGSVVGRMIALWTEE
jgi:hypothetical protein